MFYHVKDLQFNARVSKPDPRLPVYCSKHSAVLTVN